MAWWKKALIGACGFVIWLAGLGVAGSLGHPSGYFWFCAAMLAIVGAAAPFWRHRKTGWFWPSIGILVVANVALMYLERYHVAQTNLPSKGVFEALLIVDCIACWLLIVGFAYVVDGRLPWKADETDKG